MPAYGERWAQVWLDLARYADSNGYAEDQPRTIWKYRDWVIDAINDNMPFDQFTIEQIAGDMLPSATTDQILATAFHRNTLTNTEGGTNDEEFRNVAVVDRVNTTFQVWMGITMACAQCHDHKYDPITQEEYFQVFAIFNQTEDSDKPDNSPNSDVSCRRAGTQKGALEAESGRSAKAGGQGLSKHRSGPSGMGKGSRRETSCRPRSRTILAQAPAKRKQPQKDELANYLLGTLPESRTSCRHRCKLKAELGQLQPVPTPIMRELPEEKKRVTKIHIRGNWLNQGKEVSPAFPRCFRRLPPECPPIAWRWPSGWWTGETR